MRGKVEGWMVVLWSRMIGGDGTGRERTPSDKKTIMIASKRSIQIIVAGTHKMAPNLLFLPFHACHFSPSDCHPPPSPPITPPPPIAKPTIKIQTNFLSRAKFYIRETRLERNLERLTRLSPFSFVKFAGNPTANACSRTSISPRLAALNIRVAKSMASGGREGEDTGSD